MQKHKLPQFQPFVQTIQNQWTWVVISKWSTFSVTKSSIVKFEIKLQGKSNFHCMQLKLKLFMTLKNKKNILRNIKFKVKLLVFLPKLQKLFTKGGSAHLAIPRHAHYVSLGYPVPILKYLYFFCSYLDILCPPLQYF